MTPAQTINGALRRVPAWPVYFIGVIPAFWFLYLGLTGGLGAEPIKALEQETGGWYTASAGTVYPTLQLLEDQGHVRIVETGGKKVYHITPEGEAFLAEHRDVLDDILERVREAVEGLAGGTLGDLNDTFARMAGLAYKQAWRERPGDGRTDKIVDILRRAQHDIEEVLK